MIPRVSRHLVLFVGSRILSIAGRSDAEEPLVFISAFAAGDNGANHAYQFDVKTGALKLLYRNQEVQHPFFMAVSPNNKYLYSIHAENFGGKEPEQVAAFELKGRTGELKLLNRQSTHGSASCYVDIDRTGKMVVVANYSTGNVLSLPVEANGALGPAKSILQNAGKTVDPKRQPGPHAHCFVVSPDNKYAYAADLGLDRVFGYAIDPAKATLTPTRQQFARTPPRAGPRHLTFHPKKPIVYVINEIENSVTAFDYHADTGTLIERQTISTLPDDFQTESNCADLKITPDGRFLYGTNRGHDSIAAYEIGDDGRLKLLAIEPSLGKGPQNLAITAGGEWLLCANMPENNVVVFQIDKQTGKLKATGDPVAIPSPSCILIR
jgi:6-phosphogluconolactonase